ncbi:diaminopimelate decarboxylase [Flavobacterium columnare]|uniref:Diaminopimelate decarboxylase n=1 Tax=Flavobacterium columnare (strain ATCC 49512 / CIP 103533 / TG 44/87) TaxID=1041826 RepID=G8X9V4_FLACA|nr:diaminopimelate decarboxylase [Flavobacterium columnare]AEW87302.1 diaminopimelate decarboxylase [Flavobacterium columnare ATCC 49512]
MKKRNKVFQQILEQDKAAFVIDEAKFADNIQKMQKAFLDHYPNITIGYSYKTNYIPKVCHIAHENECWAEVVSEMEVEMAQLNLNNKANIIYNGPVKSIDSLQTVIDAEGIINIDNDSDLEKINTILISTSKKAKVALRLSFDFQDNTSRFGLEMAKVLELEKKLLADPRYIVLGFHLHLPFRSLESFQFRVECMLKVLSASANKNLDYINLGGGFFGDIPHDVAKVLGISKLPSFDDYAKVLGGELKKYFLNLGVMPSQMPRLFIEPGSSVIADGMYYISKIHAKKTIQGRNYLITYAGRHLLSPTNKTIDLPLELGERENTKVENNAKLDALVVGYTCIEGDVLGKIEISNEIEIENAYIIVKNVGSYSIVMGSDFILPQPAIYSFDVDFNLSKIRSTKKAIEVYNSFIE